MSGPLNAAATLMETWMRDRALPLWTGAGFDLAAGRFEEGLTNVVDLPSAFNQNQDYKNRTFSVMFGIRFGG